MKNSTLGTLNFIPILPPFLLVPLVLPLIITQRYVRFILGLSPRVMLPVEFSPCLSAVTVYILPKSLSITKSSFLRTHTQYPLYLGGC